MRVLATRLVTEGNPGSVPGRRAGRVVRRQQRCGSMKPPNTGSRLRVLPWALSPGSDHRRTKRLSGRVPERVHFDLELLFAAVELGEKVGVAFSGPVALHP